MSMPCKAIAADCSDQFNKILLDNKYVSGKDPFILEIQHVSESTGVLCYLNSPAGKMAMQLTWELKIGWNMPITFESEVSSIPMVTANGQDVLFAGMTTLKPAEHMRTKNPNIMLNNMQQLLRSEIYAYANTYIPAAKIYDLKQYAMLGEDGVRDAPPPVFLGHRIEVHCVHGKQAVC